MGQKGKQNLKSTEAQYFMEALRLLESEEKTEEGSRKEKESREMGQKGKHYSAEEESRKEMESKQMGQKGKQNSAEEESMKEKESKDKGQNGKQNMKRIKTDECFMEALRHREQKEAESDGRYLQLISDNSKPEEENKLLRRRILELEIELRAVRALNLKYQENAFSDINNAKESLRNVNEEAKQNLADKINSGELLPFGYVDAANQNIHARGGIWMLKRDYDFVKFRKSGRPEMFIKNIAVKLFFRRNLKAMQCLRRIQQRQL